MSKKRKTNNSNLVTFRTRPGAKEKLDELVERSASDKTAVINDLILGVHIPLKQKRNASYEKLLGKNLATLMEIKSLLQQFEGCNCDEGKALFALTNDMLLDNRNALFQLDGRKP